MYSLYFERSTGEEILVRNHLEREEVFSEISQFINRRNPNFKIYYFRTWGDNPIIYDVGSHTEFFKLYRN